MFIISNLLGSSVQISMLPLPVLSTLQASGLVFNSICATLILGEPFTRWSLWGTLLVCSGAVLIAVFGAIPAPAHNLNELLALLGRKPFIVWMSLQAVFVIAIAIAVDVVAATSTKLSQLSRFRFAQGLIYGCISGILSAHSLLVAKSAVELIIKTIVDGNNQFTRWESWALVLALVTLALTQLYYLHRGLKLVSTSVLYPLVFCIYNIIAILDGLIYFKQTDQIGPLRACLISLGTVILLAGVLALSWRLNDEQHTPTVGQSSLAPGLGLVEDTDGEEEEEELLLGSDIADDEESALLPRQYSYQTFPENGDSTTSVSKPSAPEPLRRSSTTKSTSSRWAERDEIWDELEDQENPGTPTHPPFSRHRSSTLPAVSESSHLLPARRAASGSAPQSANVSTEALANPRGRWRSRRKSTGFPGFHARKTQRRKSSAGLGEAIGGVLRWWGGSGKGKGPASGEGGHEEERRWPDYRDDPDEEQGSSSRPGGGSGSAAV